MSEIYQHDVLVIGSGAAGLTVALQLAPDRRIAVLSKGSLRAGSTYWAQGGVAAVLGADDSVEAHVEDTLNAGAGLCDEDAVRFTVEQSRASIQWLIDLGVPFSTETRSDGTREFHLNREGGHSRRRIIHAADATGAAISKTLLETARSTENIELFQDRVAVDVIVHPESGRCIGAYVLDKSTGNVDLFLARSVVLACGGASKVYLYTSNPDEATGDGIAIAWRAGCKVANMEFNQFHPTCLYHPEAKSFLLTEALRGEGAKLRLPDGTRFMSAFDEREELAPRDIVARAIDHEMKRLGIDCVYLDISHRPREWLEEHFPTVFQRCMEFGFDLSQHPVPVVPAAHYTCGGVMIDHNGSTNVPGLYAVGETACTGLHGANRMASNSLLECVVYGSSAASHIQGQLDSVAPVTSWQQWDESLVTDSDEAVVISHNWQELRHFMWNYVGIVRTNKRIRRAKYRVDLLRKEIFEFYSNYRVTSDLLELRNLVEVADLIIRSAMGRHESRGLHYTLDYPQQANETRDTVLVPGETDTSVPEGN